MKSPLFPTFRKRINDAVEEIIRLQVTPWAFLTAGPPFRVKYFNGKQIAYQGIGFEGSPRQVFWGRYIEPFLENLCVSEVDAALATARDKGVDASILLPEVQELLIAGYRKIYAQMADVDRRLRGKGYPEKVELRSVDRELGIMTQFVGERVRAELTMLKPVSTGAVPNKDQSQSASKTAVILTAIKVETASVLRHLSNVHTKSVGGTWFHIGENGPWTVAVAEAGAGNNRAATIGVRAFTEFKPEIAAFVGVAGGVKDVVLGDVVVSSRVYGYESGKETPEGFRPRPDVMPSNHDLEQRARVIRLSLDWHKRLTPSLWPDKKPEGHVGPIAAGEVVVANDKGRIATFLKNNYGDALAVEMEGRGFLEAAHIDSQCRAIVVRGISDLLSGKSEADAAGSQERAADSAAAFFFQMLNLVDGKQPNGSGGSVLQSPPSVLTPFSAVESKDGPARFRAPGEVIGGTWDPVSLGGNGTLGPAITLQAGPAAWLRLMPLASPGRTWPSQELRKHAVATGRLNLAPIADFNIALLRAADGIGICSRENGIENETPSVAFVFETGEIWAVDTMILGHQPTSKIFVGEIERAFNDCLASYGRLLAGLGIKPPYHWSAGLTSVKGRHLAIPIPPGQMPIFPGQAGPECLSENIDANGTFDGTQTTQSALYPFYKVIYDKCGVDRPDWLPR